MEDADEKRIALESSLFRLYRFCMLRAPQDILDKELQILSMRAAKYAKK